MAVNSGPTGVGSYFLNGVKHAAGGQRQLSRRKTGSGMPGDWNKRFKSAWELIARLSRRLAGLVSSLFSR